MSEQTKRTGAIVAVLAFVLAVGLLGYWLGRGTAQRDAIPPQNPVAAQKPAAALAPTKTAAPLKKASAGVKAGIGMSISASAIPAKWRFAGISQYRTAGDSESWLSLYPDHRDVIERFNRRYPFAWNVTSSDEIAWLAKNGFPMPEDMIAADAMSDEDLRREADAGSSKALMLYSERLQAESIAAMREEMKNGGSLDEVAQRIAASMPQTEFEIGRISSAVRGMDTPFFGYVEANRPFLAENETVREENFAAGLALAYARGDDRARFAVLGAGTDGMISEERASMAYRVMATIRDYFPVPGACDPRISTPFPKPAPPE